MILIQCDREGCPSQQGEGSEGIGSWLVVHKLDDDGDHRQYCSADCAAVGLVGFFSPSCHRTYLDGDQAWPAERIPSEADLEYARQIFAAVPHCAWTGSTGDSYCIARVAKHGDICRDHQLAEVPEGISND